MDDGRSLCQTTDASGQVVTRATALAPIFAGASPIENPRWEIQALL
jgi:pectin methylesterase-like acyl-CoA thioesterase